MNRAVPGLLLGAISVSAIADELAIESSCVAFVQDETGPVRRVELPSVHVLEETESVSEFALPADIQIKPAGLMCFRSSIVPSQNDYKVLGAGFPFYVS